MKNDTCPCCGLEKQYTEKPLCVYCLIRSNLGASKFIVFKTMLEMNGNKFITANDLLPMVNNFRESISVKPIKYEALMKILRRYSQHYESCKAKGFGYLVIVHRKKIPGSKKPVNTYRLSAEMVKRVRDYEDRWMYGLVISKKNKKGIPFLMTGDYSRRARAIRVRIQTGKIGLYDFILFLQKKHLHH
ncbi:hypothetical protein [uncultured Methanolobus sp.]|uniref:hypothetical protein n=1 Tax=uncultured Methanolobus sp. TaxID=218300 RepID=UPI002AAAFD57|nr:hypothetical protein [uncultured Methanolobus sp.]